ncbi:MAG: hypothetical protein I3273_03385 [Candidatus Moeniiplasma glomeromycotorum]|nr:hypothetical protein [Candidatus Moeniiplasma glomeromycotorum]MCE8167744.1 hypothetical protein [Candidatus Moeniiplasma glomeromycotorum]MCE8169144.1 hypothetical protein [Candidatus Moeniiplasma glomeromycotorum]
MSFFWKFSAPDKGWWVNYRWHITEPSKKLGLKDKGWEKVFFRSGWQSKILEVEDIEGAKKTLQALQNGTITAFGGRFRGSSYDKNAERMIKQAKRSLKAEIKKNVKGENIKVEETAIVPSSYYQWGRISFISGIVLVVVLGLGFLVWWKKSRKGSL